MTKLSSRRLVVLALLVEGALAAIFVLWVVIRDRPPTFTRGIGDLAWGALAVLPLFLVNAALLRWQPENLHVRAELERFRTDVLFPLTSALDPPRALIVSLLAGTGEELFFRGVLQNELGLILSSALFAGLHFGSGIRRFPRIASLYFLVSLYIGVVYAWYDSLLTVITLHALYDFLALVYLRSQRGVRSHDVIRSRQDDYRKTRS